MTLSNITPRNDLTGNVTWENVAEGETELRITERAGSEKEGW